MRQNSDHDDCDDYDGDEHDDNDDTKIMMPVMVECNVNKCKTKRKVKACDRIMLL